MVFGPLLSTASVSKKMLLNIRLQWNAGTACVSESECTKIARFSAAAAAIFTAPPKIARFFEAPRCAISSAKKIASEPRFLLRRKWEKMVLIAEFPAIPSSAIKIASERRCAILVHSDSECDAKNAVAYRGLRVGPSKLGKSLANRICELKTLRSAIWSTKALLGNRDRGGVRQNVPNARGGGTRPESCPSKTWIFDG